jgi:hypothetical protein
MAKPDPAFPKPPAGRVAAGRPAPVYQGPSPADLPAGDARRDAQREAADDLAEQAAKQEVDGGAIDPKAFRIDREIAAHFNELEVTEAQPEFEYCWVNAGHAGRFIKAKLSERVRLGESIVPVWEVVQGDMPEARELRGMMADTTRRLGDVILMRAKKDAFLRVKQLREARRQAMHTGTTTELQEMAEQQRRLGRSVVIRTDFGPDQLEQMGRRALVRQQAGQMIDGMLRNGTVPGLGRPGSR